MQALSRDKACFRLSTLRNNPYIYFTVLRNAYESSYSP